MRSRGGFLFVVPTGAARKRSKIEVKSILVREFKLGKSSFYKMNY